MNYDVTIQTIAWFNGRRNDESLIISPKWQRRAVWLEKERSTLLETVFLSMPFPEIYVQIVTDGATGAQRYVVVDGQQRMTSIFMFIDNQISLPESAPWNGKKFRDLQTDEERQAFWNYKVVVRQIYTDSDAEIRGLFARLNSNSYELNDQELRNAKYMGKFKKAAERLADNPIFQSIRLFTPREIRRMEDVEYVSELLLLTVEGITNKKDLLDGLYARFDEDFPREAEFEEDFNAAIQLLNALVTPENATLIKTKSNFYSLFGICLRYWRTQHRLQWTSLEAARIELSAVFNAARNFDPANPGDTPQNVQEYYDAVSRASSDKQRRVTRETVLWNILGNK